MTIFYYASSTIVKVPKILRVNRATKDWKSLSIPVRISSHHLHYPRPLSKAERKKMPVISAHVSRSSHAFCQARARKFRRFNRCRLWRLRTVALVRPTRHILLRLLSGDNTRHFCVAPVDYRTQALRLRLLFPSSSSSCLLFFFVLQLEQHSACSSMSSSSGIYLCLLLTDSVLGMTLISG